MRCKNCHTVMMDTDSHCPTCRSPVARATAAPPVTIAKPSGLAMALPIFGGAIGGLLYGAIAGSETTVVPGASTVSRQSSSSSPLKWIVGLVLLLVGGLFLLGAILNATNTWKIAQREATVLSAAELVRTTNPDSAPSWIAYTFTESKPTKLAVTRRRLNNAGDVRAKCLLVRVENQWLLASVAPGFEGERLVGRLLPSHYPNSKALIDELRKSETPPLDLLPFEFNAVDGSASDQHFRYVSSATMGAIALVAVFIGLYLICTGLRRA